MAKGPRRHRSPPGGRLALAARFRPTGAGTLARGHRSGAILAPSSLATLADNYPPAAPGAFPGSGAGRLSPCPANAQGLRRILVVTLVTVIGVGIDLVDLERVRALLAHKGEQAMTRFFSPREREYLATRTDP